MSEKACNTAFESSELFLLCPTYYKTKNITIKMLKDVWKDISDFGSLVQAKIVKEVRVWHAQDKELC